MRGAYQPGLAGSALNPEEAIRSPSRSEIAYATSFKDSMRQEARRVNAVTSHLPNGEIVRSEPLGGVVCLVTHRNFPSRDARRKAGSVLNIGITVAKRLPRSLFWGRGG